MKKKVVMNTFRGVFRIGSICSKLYSRDLFF